MSIKIPYNMGNVQLLGVRWENIHAWYEESNCLVVSTTPDINSTECDKK